ncbi:MAG: hypothetical protein H5T86_02135 [Armatimonadetes bacterium]|nr:hypothetical protein [Armatimonadota bacterium]
MAGTLFAPAFVMLLAPGPSPAPGPLTVCKQNPRYFADPSGKPVYLSGIHTWNNFKDIGPTDPPAPFDYDAYLDLMVRLGHNFIRLWTWDLTKWAYDGYNTGLLYCQQFPWKRTGPGVAKDGKPRFDLTQYDPSYFQRLRERVIKAGQRGIYVSIMLFEGHGTQCSKPPLCWDGHPFNPANNVNGIDGDQDRDGRGLEVYTLKIPAITRIQEQYVRRVVDAVNDLDNVLYEICNEAGPYSTEWQYHMIRFIKDYERTKRKQHPVGMTFQYRGGSNQALFDSPADWISPNPDGGYRDDPPVADGRKVVLNDTDHLWGIGGNQAWVWKSFCRGHNPIFMDPYANELYTDRPEERGKLDARWDPIRRSLGYTRRFALRVDLARALPLPALASSRYCLAVPGEQYLVYVPGGGTVSVDVTAARGQLRAEWFDPSTGRSVDAGAIEGGARRELTAPFPGDAVLFLHK